MEKWETYLRGLIIEFSRLDHYRYIVGTNRLEVTDDNINILIETLKSKPPIHTSSYIDSMERLIKARRSINGLFCKSDKSSEDKWFINNIKDIGENL